MQAIEAGLADPLVRTGHRLSLFLRAETICSKPKSPFRKRLKDFSHEPLTELPKVGVTGTSAGSVHRLTPCIEVGVACLQLYFVKKKIENGLYFADVSTSAQQKKQKQMKKSCTFVCTDLYPPPSPHPHPHPHLSPHPVPSTLTDTYILSITKPSQFLLTSGTQEGCLWNSIAVGSSQGMWGWGDLQRDSFTSVKSYSQPLCVCSMGWCHRGVMGC